MTTKDSSKVQKLKLEGQKREIFGKKLKKLRKEDKVPANIFGPDIKSQAITVNTKEFKRVYKTAKETAVVYLKVADKETPVLIRSVQKHPVLDLLLHIDFRKIDLTQKIETKVPVEVVGEAPAVEQKGGVLLTHLNELTVEALPNEIPSNISIDISALVEIGDEIKISDLPKSDKYTIKEETEKAIVSVIEHKEESLVAETTPAEQPEILEEKPEGEADGEEGAEVVEKGKEEAPKEEEKKEDKQKKPSEAKPDEKK